MKAQVSAALAAFLLVTTSAAAQMAPSNATRLQLAVTGTASMPADQAVISTGVTTTASTSAAATAANGRRMTQIFAALRNAGIEEGAISTSRVNLRPTYHTDANGDDDEARGIVGYSAQNQITVTISNLSLVSDATQAMIDAGATELNGPNFGLVDRSALVAAARRNASSEAQNRARLYAESFGLRIDHVTLVSEFSQPNVYDSGSDIVVTASIRNAPSPPLPSMPIAVGTAANLAVTATVQLTVEYTLVPR